MTASVLVVDDEADVRLMLRLRLRAPGRELLFADDAASGLALAREQAPDVVVLDYRLPDRRGTEVARELLADGFGGHLLVFSAHVTDELTRELAQLGLPFRPKVDLDGLAADVAAALGDG